MNDNITVVFTVGGYSTPTCIGVKTLGLWITPWPCMGWSLVCTSHQTLCTPMVCQHLGVQNTLQFSHEWSSVCISHQTLCTPMVCWHLGVQDTLQFLQCSKGYITIFSKCRMIMWLHSVYLVHNSVIQSILLHCGTSLDVSCALSEIYNLRPESASYSDNEMLYLDSFLANATCPSLELGIGAIVNSNCYR